MAELLASSRQCMAAEALRKARAQAGMAAGVPCSGIGKLSILPPQIPSEGQLLQTQMEAAQLCRTWVPPSPGCVPESVRIAGLQQSCVLKSTSAAGADTRFSEFVRNVPVPCPPPPAWWARAGEPVLQGKNCPLPNKPDNPVLPG
jgi:hypothetical protein